MPVRNGEAWLGAAIESVLGQTLADFELIVVNDGSTDATPDIISALSGRDERIITIGQPRQLGLVKALNAALAVARAPFVARLDADDMALPERLMCQTRCFDEQPDLVLLGSWAERIDDRGRRTGALRPETDPARLAVVLSTRNPLVHSSVMMRTALVKKLGGYREAFLGAEDFDLWLRLSEHGAVAILPQILVRYRVHGNSVTRRFALRQYFSTRLARAAAAARAELGTDPAKDLLSTPDWWAPQAMNEFYAEAAAVCRFLEMADATVMAARGTGDVRLPSAQQLLEFSHAEKALAERSLLNLMTARDRPAALSLHRLVAALATLLIGRAWVKL